MWLTISSGKGEGLAVKVEGERCLVGSGRECRLVVHDDGVAPVHALFAMTDEGGLEVQDLHTDSGTWVNGQRIHDVTALADGDQVRIGDTVLTATLGDPADNGAVADPVVEVTLPPEPGAPTPQDDAVALVTAPEGSHVEVVGKRQRRRLRERVRRATILAAAAAALAIAAAIGAVITLTGGDDTPTTEEIVAGATPSTVLVAASIPEGQSIGTGWVLDAREGLIVTNFHVVNGADGITVTGQETSADAQVVGAAPCEDLAVLKLPETKGLKTLPLGSQDELRAGEAVVAIGYPVNASNEDKLVSTAGVISVVQSELRARSAELPQFSNLVQTDAAINHGNSGGPLVDLRGRLVGVNTLVPPPDTGITGQGYAIGVDRVRPVVAQLRQGRSPGWAGFGFVFASDRQAMREGLPTKGLLISAAMPGTPATKAHIGKGGALMLAINGQTLEGTMADYCSKVEGIELGQSVPVTLLDAPGDKPRTVAIEFG